MIRDLQEQDSRDTRVGWIAVNVNCAMNLSFRPRNQQQFSTFTRCIHFSQHSS